MAEEETCESSGNDVAASNHATKVVANFPAQISISTGNATLQTFGVNMPTVGVISSAGTDGSDGSAGGTGSNGTSFPGKGRDGSHASRPGQDGGNGDHGRKNGGVGGSGTQGGNATNGTDARPISVAISGSVSALTLKGSHSGTFNCASVLGQVVL